MEFPRTQQHRSAEPGEPSTAEPQPEDRVTTFVREGAMAKLVETLSGGWITLEYEDAEEPQAQERLSFAERLELGLANLNPQTAPARLENDPPDPAPVPPQPQMPASLPSAHSGMHRARTFGRKGL